MSQDNSTEALREIAVVAGKELRDKVTSVWALLFTVFYLGATLGVGSCTVSLTEGVRSATQQVPDEEKKDAVWNLLHQMNQDPMLTDFIVDVPTVILVSFLLSIWFVPFLIFLMSQNVISSAINSKTVRYDLIRSRRWAWFGGKVVAHWALFAMISLVVFVSLVAFTVARAEAEFDVGAAALYGLRFWLVILVYGSAFVALTVGMSCFFTRPVASFFVLGILFAVLWGIRDVEGLGVISPFAHAEGLWHPASVELVKSLSAYVVLGAIGAVTGGWWFTRRDL